MKNGQFYDFRTFLGNFLYFWPVFIVFGGISNIFWTLSIMGGDHGSTLILHFFIFWQFLDFWPVLGILAS